MWDSLKSTLDYFFNPSVKGRNKLITIAAFLFFFWIGDRILGFTTFSFTNRKSETVQKINNVLQDSSLDSLARVELRKDLIETSRMKSFGYYVESFLGRIINNMIPANNKNRNVSATVMISDYNIFLLIFTSIGLYLLIGILVIFGKRKGIGTLAIDIVILLFTNYLIISLINALPLLTGDRMSDRYYSNIIYQIIFLIVFIVLIILAMFRTGQLPKRV